VRLVLPKLLDERSKELLREFGKINGEDVRHGLIDHGGHQGHEGKPFLLSVSLVSFVLNHILNTPNFGPGIGALNAAEMPRASICRVCAGSMMPSSHSLAVE